MTPDEFAGSIPGFAQFTFVEKIKRFCWYLAADQKLQKISARDVSRCFDQAGCPRPTSIAPFLASLVAQKFLLRQRGDYSLSREGRDRFDSVLGRREATIMVDDLLQGLPARLTISCERVFLDEALTCFRSGAFRAAIVMTWNLAYDHFCTYIMTKHLVAFNSQLPITFPKARLSMVTLREDFETLKESEVLQVARSANIISGSVHKILKEKLDRRNTAAHPSSVVISRLTAEDCISDLIENVVLKF